MSDPDRLLDQRGDDFERELLRSASEDVGPDRYLQQTLSAMKAAAVVAGASAVAASAAKSAAAGTAAALTARVETMLLVKLFLGGALAGLVTVGAVQLARHPVEPAATGVPAAVVPTAVDPLPSVAASPAAAGEPKQERGETGSAEHAPSAPSAVHAPSVATAGATAATAPSAAAVVGPEETAASPGSLPAASPRAPASSLMAEVQSLDRARAAIGARDGARALRELDRHRQEFPAGALGPEVTVLRIEALLLVGDRAGATALADQFLRVTSSGTHATRVRSLLGPRSNP